MLKSILPVLSKLMVGVVFILVYLGNTQELQANPRIVHIAPLITNAASKIGEPLGISVIFSENVYGFDKNDIIANGRILAVEGENKNYRVLIIPTQKILVVDILTDSVKNIRAQGNDPLAGGPFVYKLEGGRTLSTQNTNIPFTPYVPLAQTPAQTVPQAQVQTTSQVQSAAQVQAQSQTATIKEPKKRQTRDIKGGSKFTFNTGVYSGGASFINYNQQSFANPGNVNEITLGFESIIKIKNSPVFMSIYGNTGYQLSRYSSGSNVDAGETSQGSYTAIPLEFGGNLYFTKNVNMGVGAITHLNGNYNHQGYFRAASGGSSNSLLDTNAKLENGALGIAINLGFVFNKVGFSFRYVSLPLKNFDESSRNLGFDNIIYQTSNTINHAGLFLNFRS